LNIGFIGIGKIATAVIEGLCTSALSGATLRLSPRNEERSKMLARKFPNVIRMDSNQEVIDQSEIIILALRPPQAEEVLIGLTFSESHQIVSLIPLLRHTDILKMVYPAHHVARAIPLPPVVNHNCPIPIFSANNVVVDIFNNLGQPLLVNNEDQLHALWTLTCLITPYYDLLQELSVWTTAQGVDRSIANQYIANLFQALSYTAQIAEPIEFDELAKHAATPNGMNEQAGREIHASGAHHAYREAADRILLRFPKGL